MIIVRIIGGLGNQMFQYAYALSLKNKGYDVKLDISSFEEYTLHGGLQLAYYKIDVPIASKEEIAFFSNIKKTEKLFSLFNSKIRRQVKEHGLNFKQRLLNIKPNSYVKGYFQSEKYFKEIRNKLKNTFELNSISEYTKMVDNKISISSESISLHIRRGDYVSNKNAYETHGICELDYYYKAIKLIENTIHLKTIFVFSDDINWCKENFFVDNINLFFVDSINNNLLPHEDIYLMSKCKHNIIANSSFSWWGAWLNDNEEKIIIAPKIWYKNKKKQNQILSSLIPDKWIRV